MNPGPAQYAVSGTPWPAVAQKPATLLMSTRTPPLAISRGRNARAQKYAPDQLNDVQTKYDDLQTAFTAQDYKGVLGRGPAVLTAAQGLAAAATAQKAELTQQLNDQWNSVSSAVPEEATVLQSRIDMLSRKNSRKLAHVDRQSQFM